MHKFGNYYPPFSLRVSDELMDKLKYLAEKNRRSINKQIEFILDAYISDYEKENGAIILDERD